jgi:hypothetical protein
MTQPSNPPLTLVFGVKPKVTPAAAPRTAGSDAAFFTAALPYAQQEFAATGVHTSVVLAQWADEQGYRWPAMYNNPGNVGDPVNAGQVGYPTVEAGVQASINTMLLGYYTGVRAAVGWLAQCYALGQSPWAGGHYDASGGPPGQDLVWIINTFNLTQYDGASPTPPPPAPPKPPAPIFVAGKQLTGKVGNLNAPVVAVVATTSGNGYIEVGADGGTFNYGDAKFFGSLAGIKLNAPIIDAALTKDNNGLYLVATDGGVFALGDAAFYGSAGSIKLAQPVVSIALSQDGKGYWLVAADGGVFAYGDAPFLGTPA